MWWTKQIYFSTKLYFHSISPEIKDILSPAVHRITLLNNILSRDLTVAIRILICFSRLLNLNSTPGLALLIEISYSPPEVTLGFLVFLEKDLLPPEDSSFSLGIQLGTYIYNRRWNNLFRIILSVRVNKNLWLQSHAEPTLFKVKSF